VKRIQAAPLVALLDTLFHQSPGGALATDADGTLWTGDVGTDLWTTLADDNDLRAEAICCLTREARAFGLAEAPSGRALLKELERAFCEGTFPEERFFELVAWCCVGCSRLEVDAYANRVVSGLQHRLQSELHPVLSWAEQNAVDVFVVSASPEPLIRAALRVVGPHAHVIALRPQWSPEGIMLADVERPIPFGEGKRSLLRTALGPRPLYAAFGDSAFDLPMLAEATIPVAVRPKAPLRACAHALPRLVELIRELPTRSNASAPKTEA
jgi:phosphoserine phosphatase